MILRLGSAFNLNPAAVAFNKLPGDEETNARPHGSASSEECLEHPRQIICCNSHTGIRDGEKNAIGRLHRVLDR